MKKYFLTIPVAVCISFFLNVVQAQPVAGNPDQVQLLKQFLGTWKVEFPRGDSQIDDFSSFGSAIVCNSRTFHADTVIYSFLNIWGYDKVKNSIVEASINSSGPDILISSFVFKSDHSMESEKFVAPVSGDILATRYDFKSADLFTLTTINNGKDIATYTFKRIKK